MVYKEMIVHLSHTNKDADVNAGFTLDEQCLRKIDERSANYEEWYLIIVY